jgi:hypothetical protein
MPRKVFSPSSILRKYVSCMFVLHHMSNHCILRLIRTGLLCIFPVLELRSIFTPFRFVIACGFMPKLP